MEKYKKMKYVDFQSAIYEIFFYNIIIFTKFVIINFVLTKLNFTKSLLYKDFIKKSSSQSELPVDSSDKKWQIHENLFLQLNSIDWKCELILYFI